MIRKFAIVAGAFVLLALGFTLYSIYVYKTPRDYTEQTLIIPPNTGGRAVLAQLHAAGLTPPLPWMAAPFLLSGRMGKLKAGEYAFPTGLSPAQIIDRIARGAIVVHKLVIPEGWNAAQVRAALDAEALLSGPTPSFAEGSIFPDTVYFSRGEARSSVLAKMQKPQAALLESLWKERAPNLPLATPQEALILASIVEKETGVADERAMVAGVFVNRLRRGMPLQSDPTVAYGITAPRGVPLLGRALTRDDLKNDTLYNTYTRTGLPPGPICNPGREALLATLHPTETEALYFVASGHGGHVFAATLKEHDANVAQYRRALQQQASESQIIQTSD